MRKLDLQCGNIPLIFFILTATFAYYQPHYFHLLCGGGANKNGGIQESRENIDRKLENLISTTSIIFEHIITA